MKSKEGIVYYFGTFDPPTKAHVGLLGKIKDELGIKNAIVIPRPKPHDKPNASSFFHRCNMADLAFSQIPNTAVVNFTNYKKLTNLMHFVKSHFHNDVNLLMGADTLYDHYKLVTGFFSVINADPIIARRENYVDNSTLSQRINILERNTNKKVKVVELDQRIKDLSSTIIRENIASNPWAIDGMLHDSVYDYILEKNLYNSRDGIVCTSAEKVLL